MKTAALMGLLVLGACGGAAPELPTDPFADRVVAFRAGEGAGFGQDRFPQVVLGAPIGGGATMGGLDVLSLGKGGEIVLEFTDIIAVDGPGPDVLVFENPFPGFEETARVAASEDGVTFQEWPCDPEDAAGGFPGCAGVRPVLSSPDNGVPATDPAQAGGDAFDLAAVGLSRARFLRVRETQRGRAYGPPAGGFDLDAVAVVNGAPRAP